jgi:selenide,water dikinase
MFEPGKYPDLLVGLEPPDDAAVWKLDDDRALVVTTDFFTPVVDDPYDFGCIAAANSLSDVYAMGGKPFLALNVAALLPSLPAEVNTGILRGGADTCLQAGVVVAGGHTVQDNEPKFGLVVLGFVDPQKMITKRGAKPGDRLVLTKPLGFGVTATALKQGKASPEEITELTGWMKRLNQAASALAVDFDLHSGTDVTGFGLLGHGTEMANASKVGFKLHLQSIPFLSQARKFAGLWTFPGGAADNCNYFGDRVRFAAGISEEERMLLFDPQTSGGLLLSVPAEKASSFLEQAEKEDLPAWVIGEVIPGTGIEVL